MIANEIKKRVLIALLIILPILMAPVDLFLAPNYWVKSLVKCILFIGLPLILNNHYQWVSIKSMLTVTKKQLSLIALVMIATYGTIILGYQLLEHWFDFSMITVQLESSMAITKNNFWFVFFYIPLVNALVEEWFFRGFGFLTLKKIFSRRWSYFLSAIIFSLYHVAIMAHWFSPVLFTLLVIGLIGVGLFFNYINEKTGTFLTSYMVHAGANFAINTIGLYLFGMI